MSQTFNEPAKARIVTTLPSLGEAELGELYYDATNNKLYIRLVTGWKYIVPDG